MTQETAGIYADTMRALAAQARSVVRDLNPRVCLLCVAFRLILEYCVQDELKYLRVRAKKHELMVAFGMFGDFTNLAAT